MKCMERVGLPRKMSGTTFPHLQKEAEVCTCFIFCVQENTKPNQTANQSNKQTPLPVKQLRFQNPR